MDVSSHFRDFPAILTGGKRVYGKLQWMGQGVFGTVILYRQWGTMNQVAVKFLDKFRGLEESKILEKIKKYDPDKNNLLKLKEHFEFNLDYCIISEKLDQDILHYMCDITLEPLTVSEIRPIAQQLLVALKALKSYGIVHTDIKPDNIMFVNHEKYPFKVKLIDFGLARNVFDLNRMTLIQPLGYRAPEVVFGLPKDESVDMWGLGCSLAFMYLLRNLYPKTSVYEYIFFVCNGNHFKFKTPSEYVEFRSLLKQMLCVNSKDRITPEEALRHDFITMKHLSKRKEHYATLAHNLMSVCSCIYTHQRICRSTRTCCIKNQMTLMVNLHGAWPTVQMRQLLMLSQCKNKESRNLGVERSKAW
uniref:Protein kinase domain-containing protein n=1 Tax=Oryzias melastigma TaxID=30732 RepID=A0A3B3DCU0_ORYME